MMSAPALDILLLRGLVREAGHWLDFGERVARAFPGSEVITLDILGNGVHFRETTPVDLGAIVDAIRAEFVERRRRLAEERARAGSSEARPAVVFSMSLGGMITFEWLRRYPDDFARAVIGNTSLRGCSPFWRRLRPSSYATIARAAALGGRPLDRERAILSLVSNRRDLHERTAERWAEIGRARPVAFTSFLRQLAAAVRYAPPEGPPRTPTLLLNGAGDRLVHPGCSRDVAARFGLALEVHGDAGHELALDAPEWVVERLLAWFGALAPREAAAPAIP